MLEALGFRASLLFLQTLEAAAGEGGGTDAEDANDEGGESRLVRDKKMRGKKISLIVSEVQLRTWCCMRGVPDHGGSKCSTASYCYI